MSNSFSTSNHNLQLNSAYDELEVLRTSTNAVVQTYDLTSETKVHVESGNYVISQTASTGCHSQSFDPDDGETVEFTNARMVGVTIIRIEGTLKPDLEYDFDLEACGVYLHYQNGELKVSALANLEGSAFDDACVTISDLKETQTA